MEKIGDFLIQEGPMKKPVMGNVALVRAMIEASVRVATSYPGSPTPEIGAAIQSIPSEKNPLYFEFSVNEKVALEVAFGASINGHLSCCFFKSVGLNVAADSFVQLSLMELIGGMVVVLGDDPGAHSSQNEQDNLHIARMAYIPVLEPSTPSETYAFFLRAAQLSQINRMPVILRLTTHVCHARETVSFGKWQPQPRDDTPRFDPKKHGPYIPITAQVFPLKRRALKKLSLLSDELDAPGWHKRLDNENPTRGLITHGTCFLSCMETLEGTSHPPDILKLSHRYPLSTTVVLDFLRSHSQVLVLEELDDTLEKDIKALALDQGVDCRITGKDDVEDWIGEYTPRKVQEILHRNWPDIVPPVDPVATASFPRPAQMCPGCGHRSAFHAIKKALSKEDITVADIGCHTLGFLEPYEVGQVLLCMGHSNGTGAGLSLFNRQRKVVTFLGDSTFFHAGIPGIINAVLHGHTHTLILMQNGTTAMTGHQEHAGTKIAIRKILEAIGIQHIFEVDTYRQKELTQAVKQAMEVDAFSVVIARHPCMLKWTRELRRKGRALPSPVQISNRCKNIQRCIVHFACPTFQRKQDGAVEVQRELCIGDGSCRQTCPVDAIEKTPLPNGEGESS
ncbi:MAG TPA: thiamine pyrophosphate-dependent enzyme [Thermotogota bacterium]|nr:thiamine pyrophosphate-dependent enzyme [Thermotogota bacterium]